MGSNIWAGAKIVIVLISAFYLASMDENVSNFDIIDATFISIALLLALSGWLFLHRRHMGPGLDTSITASGQFWPMMHHPFQFWALAAISTVVGGVANIIKTNISGHGSNTIGFFICFCGIAIVLAIFIQRYFRVSRIG